MYNQAVLLPGLTPSGVKTIQAVLYNALDYAVRVNLIAQNVCDEVEVPRLERYEIQP